MRKSIGILTHYYNSTNYGGVLQSYALCKYLNGAGIDAKQVCYDISVQPFSVVGMMKRFLAFCIRLFYGLLHPKALMRIRIRKMAFQEFRNGIPHTDRVYTYKTISRIDSCFDAFITGSDQVWNPVVINDAYSLRFSNKPKFSYAASIASDTIPFDKSEYYKSFLKSFKCVSVRERNAQGLLPIESTLVLDPVFLLSNEHWIDLASPRLISEPYVFCYFLGDSLADREVSIQYAHDHNLKVVNIPFLKNRYRKYDIIPFDYSLSSISPNDFLSLILHADYVFTDSFHALCFSYIFKKQFYVFDRKTKASMNTRITDVLDTLDLTDRYVRDYNELLNRCGAIDYSVKSKTFDSLKKVSFDFIDSVIRGLLNEQF